MAITVKFGIVALRMFGVSRIVYYMSLHVAISGYCVNTAITSVSMMLLMYLCFLLYIWCTFIDLTTFLRAFLANYVFFSYSIIAPPQRIN